MSVYSLLSANSGVTAITTEIHIGQAPQITQPPYIVLELINNNAENLIGEIPNIDNEYWGIRCVGDDQATSINLYLACRDALEPNGYTQGLRFYGEHDDKTGYYQTLFDFSYWLNR